MDIFGLILFSTLILYIAFTIYSGYTASNAHPSMICPACGTQGNPETQNKGSALIELVLWLCFIIPGLIYSIWRRSSPNEICPACHKLGMIPIDSPIGQRLAAQFPGTQSAQKLAADRRRAQ